MTKQKELGFTGVYVTHDQVEAMQLADQLAVLDVGRIVQIGPPQAVYQRPANLTVARFVGTLNELAGRVVAIRDDGTVEVSTVLGPVVGRPQCDADLTVGRNVTVGIRAESLRVVTTGTPPARATNTWPGTVVAGGFAGAYFVEVFRGGEQRLNVHTPIATSRAPGVAVDEPAEVHFGHEDTLIFADASPARP